MPDPALPNDPFALFRKLWGPLGLPVPGMAMPTLDPAELDTRIRELRSVEQWLSINLNMVKMSIMGLEVQKTALEAMRAGVQPPASLTGADGPEVSTPAAGLFWPWTAMQQMVSPAVTAASDKDGDAPKR